MARKPPRPKVDPELAALHDRIRVAEKAQAPVGRELVALDKASLEVLAVLVERGVGKKPAVLARALAVGLQGLEISTRTEGGSAGGGGGWLDDEHPEQPGATVTQLFPPERQAPTDGEGGESEDDVTHVEATSLAAAAVGGSFAFSQPRGGIAVSVPPSQRRRERAHRQALDNGTTADPEEPE